MQVLPDPFSSENSSCVAEKMVAQIVSNRRYWASISVICVMLNRHSFVSRVNIKSKLTWHSLGNRLSHLGALVVSFLTLAPTAFLEHLVYTNHKLFTFLQVIQWLSQALLCSSFCLKPLCSRGCFYYIAFILKPKDTLPKCISCRQCS